MTGVSLSASVYTTATAATCHHGRRSRCVGQREVGDLAVGDRPCDGGCQCHAVELHSDQPLCVEAEPSGGTSRITDVDIAEESTQYAKWNILVQTGTAMLAQANVIPQSTLKLLQ